MILWSKLRQKFMFELPRSLYPFHGSCTCEPLLNQDGCHPKKTTNHRDVFLCRNLHWECQFQTDGNTLKFGRFPSLRICLCALWDSMKSIVKVTCLCSFWGALISRLLVCGFNLSEKYARQNGETSFIHFPTSKLQCLFTSLPRTPLISLHLSVVQFPGRHCHSHYCWEGPVNTLHLGTIPNKYSHGELP